MLDLFLNMGLRYILFKLNRLLFGRTILFKSKFPKNPKNIKTISLENWKKNLPDFFFYGKKIDGLPKHKSEILQKTFHDITKGKFIFFGRTTYNLGNDYDWITNPESKKKYDINKHWTEIKDFDKEMGDIKFVWEKSRFSFLYDIIRYDYHNEDDQSSLVFSEIDDFINKNPLNMGPNYVCSQEISLRILNWTFALYYYKDSENLDNERFQKIMNSIYWQIHHVYHNINFSRIAVRNNHAITECLMLYLSEKIFPFFPNVRDWSKKGKVWFEKEVIYQIYNDGTFSTVFNELSQGCYSTIDLGY